MVVLNINNILCVAKIITSDRRMSTVQDLVSVFKRSVQSVNPQRLIRKSVTLQGDTLYVKDRGFHLNNNVSIVGFGKAVFPMAKEIETIVGAHLVKGLVSIPHGTFSSDSEREMASRDTLLVVNEGAEFNLPDAEAERAALQIATLIENLKRDDLLIVLISGGGSALLPLPRDPIKLEEKCELIKALSQKGADIRELNCVRKRLSTLKGGGLASLAYPAQLITLILSDIIGDPLESIASGPTVPNFDKSDAARCILQKYGLAGSLKDTIKQVLDAETTMVTCPVTNNRFCHVENFIIGNNQIAADAAAAEAKRLGYQSCVLSVAISGDVSDISAAYTQLSIHLLQAIEALRASDSLYKCLKTIQDILHISEESIEGIMHLDFTKGICLIGAGEPTVHVRGSGKGGRNQQLALQFSIDVHKLAGIKDMNIALLSCGTDGIDGPTDAAGAVGHIDLYDRAVSQNLDPRTYLANNDSYNFFRNFDGGRWLIKTGHTGTNVMDIHALIVCKKGQHSKL